MLEIKQITPSEILSNQHRLDEFLKGKLRNLVNKNYWMTEWEQIAQRFQLFKLKDLSNEEILSYEWDKNYIDEVVEQTFLTVSKHLKFDEIKVTILPALPFPWFQNYDQAIWTNGFTNSPGNIIIAIPPQPDLDFLQYLLAHETHHASPENPIYNLTLDTFTLEEWYKMEGTAEFFSLSLYPDKRWWKDSFTEAVEFAYWSECKEFLKTADDKIKGRLCFGNPKKGIPYFAGYSFALNIVSNYVKTNPVSDIRDLFFVEPSKFIESYKSEVK
ncbi:DUF2268 domain-containing putative Zn-dependent protease [Peribacillus sp. FSL R5-0717]|uniref:DUF2268 domain-containing putative Zn-dependent protease n=1 Tax=Peribacillus sp. FSL R5-0717 TaxID=2975308 RepID=UPI0030F976D0